MIEARGIDLVAAADEDPAKLADFRRRWGCAALYTDYREMIEKEAIDVVCLTTRPEPRAEITVGLAELGVKAIFATKPMCRTLAEADAMIDACARHGVILAMACHLNWYGYYTTARRLIAEGAIGPLKTMVCHSPSTLSNIQSHTLALLRLFAGAPAQWVVGLIDTDEQARSEADIPGIRDHRIRKRDPDHPELPVRIACLRLVPRVHRRNRPYRIPKLPRPVRVVGASFSDWRTCPDPPARTLASQEFHGRCDRGRMPIH